MCPLSKFSIAPILAGALVSMQRALQLASCCNIYVTLTPVMLHFSDAHLCIDDVINLAWHQKHVGRLSTDLSFFNCKYRAELDAGVLAQLH